MAKSGTAIPPPKVTNPHGLRLPPAAGDLIAQLHRDASAEPPHPALRRVHVILATLRKAALPLLADPDDWSEYYDGLALYLLGAGKYRNLDAFAKRVVFSCRSLDYSTPLSTPELRVPQVQIEPMADDQIRRFIELCAPDRAAALWEKLAGTPQLGLLRAPYFLKLLVDQVEAEGDIPDGRAGLFAGFVRQAMRREIERDNPLFQPDTLVAERDYRRIVQARAWRTPWELPERGVLFPSLARLAHAMQLNLGSGETAQVRIGYDEALDRIHQDRREDIVRAGVALAVLDEDPERDEVLFFHQLLQEYFAARESAENPNPELVRQEWRQSHIQPPIREVLESLALADELPPLPTTGWEETTVLAAAMAQEPEGFIRGVMEANLALAGRCANQSELGGRLAEAFLDELRWALVARSRDVAADLRDRIACGFALGDLGDPRFERRTGPYGEYLTPPLVETPGGAYPIGEDEPIEVPGWGAQTSHMPRHSVTLAPFMIGRFPVTNAEWSCFMAAGGYDDERWWVTDDARAWRRGEGMAEGPRRAARSFLARLRARPEALDEWLTMGQLDEDVCQRWKRRLAMTEEEFEAHLCELSPAGRATKPRLWREERFNNGAQPVVGVCWYEARAYCVWLSAQTGLSVRPANGQLVRSACSPAIAGGYVRRGRNVGGSCRHQRQCSGMDAQPPGGGQRQSTVGVSICDRGWARG